MARDDVPDTVKQQAAEAFARQYPPPGTAGVPTDAFTGETPSGPPEQAPSFGEIEKRRAFDEPIAQIKDGLHAFYEAHNAAPTGSITSDMKADIGRNLREIGGLFAPLNALYGGLIAGPAEYGLSRAGWSPEAARTGGTVAGIAGSALVSPETLASKLPGVGEPAAAALSKVPLMGREPEAPLNIRPGETMETAVRRTAGVGEETALSAAETLGRPGAGEAPSAPSLAQNAVDTTVKPPIQRIYDRVRDWADANNLDALPGEAAHDDVAKFSAGLKDTSALNSRQREVLAGFQADMAQGEGLTYGEQEAWKQKFDRAFPGEIWQGAPPGLQDAYDLKWRIRNVMLDTVGKATSEDAPLYRQMLETAGARWRDEVQPAERVAGILERAADPREPSKAADLMMNMARNPKDLRTADLMFRDHPQLAQTYTSGIVGNIIGDDPVKGAAAWSRLQPESRALLAKQNPALPTLFAAIKKVSSVQGVMTNTVATLLESSIAAYFGGEAGGATAGLGAAAVPIIVSQVARSRVATNLLARALVTPRDSPAAGRIAAGLYSEVQRLQASGGSQPSAEGAGP